MTSQRKKHNGADVEALPEAYRLFKSDLALTGKNLRHVAFSAENTGQILR
jgi:hypothetical protein